MLDGVFARGTTPTQVFPIPGDLTIDDFLDISVVYRQKGRNVLVKRKNDKNKACMLSCAIFEAYKNSHSY